MHARLAYLLAAFLCVAGRATAEDNPVPSEVRCSYTRGSACTWSGCEDLPVESVKSSHLLLPKVDSLIKATNDFDDERREHRSAMRLPSIRVCHSGGCEAAEVRAY